MSKEIDENDLNGKIRLYRAMKEYEINGISSIFYDTNKQIELDKHNIPSEIYSHILPTHTSKKYPYGRGIMYSFSDTFEQAKYWLDKDLSYKTIGYIDIEVKNAMITKNENILYCKRMYKLEDWIDLIMNMNDEEFVNLNYGEGTIKKPVENALLPGSKTTYSWSKRYDEYLLICKDLKLNLVDNLNNDSKEIKYNNMLIDKVLDINYIIDRGNRIKDNISKYIIKYQFKKDDVYNAIDNYIKFMKKLNITGN